MQSVGPLSAAAYARIFGAHGIRPGQPIVVSGDPGSFDVTYTLWALNYIGLDHARVYFGGIQDWIGHGGRVGDGDRCVALPAGHEREGQEYSQDFELPAFHQGALQEVVSSHRTLCTDRYGVKDGVRDLRPEHRKAGSRVRTSGPGGQS